jgi:hypothetical protein
MADNQFSNRPGESSDINEREIIVRELLKEFPNDPLLQQGILSPEQKPEVKPVTDIAKRNPASGLLEVDADVSAVYAEYNLSKLLPGLDEDALDEALDDEFTTFIVNEPGSGLPVPVVSGLFYITTTMPGDFHDMYIQYGVERIPEMLASGMDDESIQRNLFCVWYVERNKARPIPNYKTLEVMLVERNLTYDSVAVATADDIRAYDLRLDGRYEQYTLTDENGNTLPPPTFIDELVVRQVINRSPEWNTKIRYLSGYRPGKTFNASIAALGVNFLRDPADYIRPKEKRVSMFIETVEDENGLSYSRDVLPREARQRQEILAQLTDDPALQQQYGLEEYTGPINPISTPQLFSLLDEDPYDLYYDSAFRPSRIENMRAEMEGKLVLPEWSKAALQTAFDAAVTAGTDDLRFDDLYLNLSMMVFGHFKQVQDINVLKRIATDLNIDISDYDSSKEVRLEGTDVLDQNQFRALSDIRGIINVMYLRGAIKLLGGTTDEYWTTFAKIGNVDQLDIVEYEKYQIEYRDIFTVQELIPFEPAGSTAYYQRDQLSRNYLANLQQQAILQGELDKIRQQIYDQVQPVQGAIDALETELSKVPDNFLQRLQDLFGPDSDVQNILFDSANTLGDINAWVLQKRRNGGETKEKGRKESFFALVETEGQISRDSLSKQAEDEIFSGIGAPDKPFWHINGRSDDDICKTMISAYSSDAPSPKLLLLNEAMIGSLNNATKDGGAFEVSISKDRIFQKPSRGNSKDRINRLMKDANYFKATVAKYIYVVILQSAKVHGETYVPSEFPTDIYAAIGVPNSTSGDLVTICEKVNEFLLQVKQTLSEVRAELLDFDEKLINSNDPEELILLQTQMAAVLALQDRLRTDVFTSIGNIDAYITDQHAQLLNRIVQSIEFVRQRVKDKNDKYYITWPGLSTARVSKWKSDYNFKQHQPSGT